MRHEPEPEVSKEEAEDRLRTILKGAFSGSPAPLKAAKKRNSKSISSDAAASAKNARRAP